MLIGRETTNKKVTELYLVKNRNFHRYICGHVRQEWKSRPGQFRSGLLNSMVTSFRQKILLRMTKKNAKCASENSSCHWHYQNYLKISFYTSESVPPVKKEPWGASEVACFDSDPTTLENHNNPWWTSTQLNLTFSPSCKCCSFFLLRNAPLVSCFKYLRHASTWLSKSSKWSLTWSRCSAWPATMGNSSRVFFWRFSLKDGYFNKNVIFTRATSRFVSHGAQRAIFAGSSSSYMPTTLHLNKETFPRYPPAPINHRLLHRLRRRTWHLDGEEGDDSSEAGKTLLEARIN